MNVFMYMHTCTQDIYTYMYIYIYTVCNITYVIEQQYVKQLKEPIEQLCSLCKKLSLWLVYTKMCKQMYI